MRTLAIVAVVIAAAAPRARAECADPHWIGTEASHVPLEGSLYVYSEPLGDRPRRRDGAMWDVPGQARYSDVSPFVTRIDYEGDDASTLQCAQNNYRLDRFWRAPADAPKVQAYWHAQDSWTCSYHDLLMVELDQPTAAVRARWTYRGRTTEWVVPAHDRLVALGKIDCGGTTLPPEELAEGGTLELIAIRLDRSEVPISGLPRILKTASIPTPPAAVAEDQHPLQPRELEPEPPSRWRWLVLGLVAALLPLVVFQSSRREV